METIKPREKDLGGFSVRRLIPYHRRQSVGPFIFFDHMGPAHFAKNQGVDVRPHPHIGLATVTYLFEGELFHRDSLGNAAAITAGAINLMVAGKGIVHSERSSPESRAKEDTLHALQLWLALPKEDEDCEPVFHHYPSKSIPKFTIDNTQIRVMIGEAYGHVSPVKTFSPTLYVEAMMEAGATLRIPAAEELAVYMVKGSTSVEGTILQEHHLILVKEGATLTANEACHLVMIGGEPLGKRHIWWNLVSTDKTKIEQAKQDWENQAFPAVPGETEFIPLPKS